MIANLPVEEPELCQAALEAATSASKRPRPHHKFDATPHGEVMKVNGKRLSSGETAPMDPSIPGYRDGNGRTLSLNDSKPEEDAERPSRYMRVDVDGATDIGTENIATPSSMEDEAEDEGAHEEEHEQEEEPDIQRPVPILTPPPLESDNLSDEVPAAWIVDDDDDTVLPLPDTSNLYTAPPDAQEQHQQQLNEFMSLSVLDGGVDAYCKVMQPKVPLVQSELPPSVAGEAAGTQTEQTNEVEHHHQPQEQQEEEQKTQVTNEVSKEKALEAEVPDNGEGSFVPSTEAHVSPASALPDTPAEEKNGDEPPVASDGAQEQSKGEGGGNILETLMKMTSPLSGVETLSPPGDSREDLVGVGGEMNEWAETLGLDDGNEVQDVMPMLEQRACKLDMDVDLDLDLGSDELKEPLEDSAVEDLFGAEDGLECLI